MTQPVPEEGADDQADWLVDAADPQLTTARLTGLADPSRPDRLAWNTFRTLGLWDTDAWVPALLEVACGPDNRLSSLDWGGASIRPWALAGLGPEVCDVVIDGPGAYVVVACTLAAEPPGTQLRAAAVAALDGSLHGSRDAGLVVVVPPGAERLDDRLYLATAVELHDGRLVRDLLEGAIGWMTWANLGRLALDLAEEGSDEPMELVHRLVTELQTAFPGVAL